MKNLRVRLNMKKKLYTQIFESIIHMIPNSIYLKDGDMDIVQLHSNGLMY